jgi:hypothetical protein
VLLRLVGNAAFGFGIAHSPIEALDLVHQHGGFSIRQQDIRRENLDLEVIAQARRRLVFPL